MPSSYTPSLRLVLPVEGDLDGTWGNVINNQFTSFVDVAVAGSANITMTDANYTLTVVDDAPDEARKMFINLSGTLTATRNVICPAVSKLYFVHNNTNQSIVFKTSTGSGVTVLTTTRAVLYCNGTDVVDAINALAAGTTVGGAAIVTPAATQTLTNKTINGSSNTITNVSLTSGVTGTLPIENGGTNATTASAARTSLGGTMLGANLFTITNPSAITFPRFNADNTVSSLNAADFRTAIGAGTGNGDVTTSGTQTLTNKTITFADNTLTGVASTGTSQTLTNKTISVDDNTISGVAASSFVLSNGSGNLDGSAAQKAIPSGVVVGTTDAQTLTSKTITFADNTLTGVAGVTATQTLTNKTVTNLVFDGDYTEEVFTITDGAGVDLDPSNGTVQVWTLGADRTATANSFASGQSMTLMIDDGASYEITWPGVVWKTDAGTAPILSTTGFTPIQLWKVSTVLYGARVGDA
jgi:hypothetical protein